MTNYTKNLEETEDVHIREEAERMLKRIREEATYIDGIMRWKSNGCVPLDDVLEFAYDVSGQDIDFHKCQQIRKEEEGS